MMLRPNKIGVHFIEYKRKSKIFSTIYSSSVWYYWKESIIKNYSDKIEESFELAELVILFIFSRDLSEDNFYKQLLELDIRKDKDKLLPIITLGSDSLTSIFDNTLLNINEKARYLDHSRWNHYFSLQGILNQGSNFDKAIHFFVQNKSNNISNEDNTIKYYDILKTNIALEYVELHKRVLENSRLEKFGGHGNYVQPFVFHSESEMRYKYSKKGEKNEESILYNLKTNNLKWRILLIDDHIDENKPLSPFDNRDIENHKHLIKQKIVANLLEEDKWSVSLKNNNESYYEEDKNIQIVSVSNIDDAVKKLKIETYDIIMLDFLLGFPKEGETRDKREFGYHLLTKIKEDKELQAKKNPINYYWILLMSAFPQAFFDKLREQGLSHHSNHWHISRGADPVNTPELFKYSLYYLMYLQIQEVDFLKIKIANHFARHFAEVKNEIRAWAKSYYQIFISKYGKIHNLKTDKKSLFSATYSKYFAEKHKEDLIYYEKMKNFLFLLANGSSSDSSQLQMSYMEISKEIKWNNKKIEHRLIEYINSMH
ncbi:MAG: hypothetical protein P1P88_02700 [Bacteroidales bacterium]|nr:hypothetical protein [Bacteroidales bacterium]